MRQDANLRLDRCPHCQIAKPNLAGRTVFDTHDANGRNHRNWKVYICASCGGVVTTVAHFDNRDQILFDIAAYWPSTKTVEDTIPERARTFLTQAIASVHAPAGAVMLTASSVDAMLKEKGLKDGSLYKRIDQAATEHLITTEMAQWAHQVRLGANEQRHADEDAVLPNEADADRAIEFALALAQFLFVLPARVSAGLKRAGDSGQ
ncbi:hypothetical protein Q072_03775 [Pseudomonas aeruginosa BL18]|nr:hypothetical protein Q072_03775 [Pseudomonas aeruginosa BL18]